ncbi:hypothetical protein EPI10_012757 [Gossypium australe]|uniref:Retrotransposon gag domain-containing protein n=1 Tax=Gossypium australe TaxID=47621 RepID=A0A5B6UJ07_9ROSI|nr:hypothetical protein EPI10_012757 [Gossypium australe]
MDQRLEQFQKEVQDQVQAQVQEQLAKIQQDMMESQRNMMSQMAQMTQLLNRLMERGKGPMAITGGENEGVPSGSTLPHVPSQHEEYPWRPSVTIRPQQGQAKIGSPMNFQVGSGSNPRDDLINLIVPDFDIMEKERMKAEPSRQMEDRYRWLEEKVKAIENAEICYEIDVKELSLVLNLVLPPKFKTPDFEKYNGTSCPEAHLKMFCRRMAGHANNEKILIHCFQDSLVGSAAKWYDQLSSTQIKTWKDLAQAFMKHYGHVADIAPDRITLQNMEKRPSESFRQYDQRWRELATQVQPPLLEKETATLFIHTLKASFINYMLGSSTKDFSEIVRCGEMIEHAIRCRKIEAGEGTRRTIPKKRESDVNNVSARDKPITLSQPSTATTDRASSHRQESNTKPNAKKLQFTPIYMTYGQLYQKLYDTHVVAPHYLQPLQPPYPKWYDANAQCEYHARIVGHSIENCLAFKRLVEKLIQMGVVKVNDTEHPLPNHANNGVNMIGEKVGKKVKMNVAEIKTPLRWVWKQMIKRGLITQQSREELEGAESHYEFHAETGHDIQECLKFRAIVQNFMDKKKVEFYEEI